MKSILIFFVFLLSGHCFGQASDICDIIDVPNCRGVTKQLRRNTFQSAPTSSTAAILNPSNVSFDKGLGLEMIAQPSNPLLFSLITGTGKMGGALISGSLDNSFFGNRIPELDEAIIERYQDDQQFKNKKFAIVIGRKLFSSKRAGLDLGLIAKRHSEIKDINPGAGISGRLWFLHFGASAYRDDVFIDLTKYKNTLTGVPYSQTFGKDSYDENFLVTTYTLGTRIKNFSFDYGKILSTLKFYDKEPTDITLYSASFYLGDFLFNAALRKEHSMAVIYESSSKDVKLEEDKSDMYYGIQYSLNKHMIFGVNYNYFLLDEFSFSATFFL